MGRLSKLEARLKRKVRIRKKSRGTNARPRLTVFRSGAHIYAQVIDDVSGLTLASASSREKDFASEAKEVENAGGSNVAGAVIVGKLLAGRAKAKGVEKVVFDRNGYLYHGRVKALADSVRDTGVRF